MSKWCLALLPLCGFAMAGCNTAPPSQAGLQAGISDCLVRYPNYSQAWNCSRGLIGSYDEYRNVYVANGDALAAQVNAGKVNDADARASLSGGFGDGGPMARGRGGRR